MEMAQVINEINKLVDGKFKAEIGNVETILDR